MYIVYALIDPRDHQIRYVGLTDDVYERFRSHIYGYDDNQAKNAWIQELRNANAMVIMQALEPAIEGLEQAAKREAYWIQHYHQLGMHLTNKIIPLHHEIIYVRTEQERTEIRLGARMTPDEQRQYVVKLWSVGLSKKTILAQVEKYIPRQLVDIVLDELGRSKRATFKSLEPANDPEVKAIENGYRKQLPEALRAAVAHVPQWEVKLARLRPIFGGELGEVIYAVWEARPGRGDRYQKARAEYDVLRAALQWQIEQMSEREA